MLKTRVIPTLLYRDFGLVKGVRFDSRRGVGAALQAIKVYEVRGVDELVFLDVAATLAGRGPDFALVDELADNCFMPLTVGGGVRTSDDIGALLRVGADKVAINTAFVENPSVVRDGADRFGSQCIVVSIDTRANADGRTTARTRCATTDTGIEAVDAARSAEELGAGEILLTSADRDGTFDGYDLATLRAVCDAVTIPVIASGGAANAGHMVEALEVGASAVAAASIYHFTHQTPREMKVAIAAAGYPVRL